MDDGRVRWTVVEVVLRGLGVSGTRGRSQDLDIGGAKQSWARVTKIRHNTYISTYINSNRALLISKSARIAAYNCLLIGS